MPTTCSIICLPPFLIPSISTLASYSYIFTMQHLTLLLLTANRKAMSSSVALLFFTLLATLSLLPPCHARSLTTVHAQELNNWHRNPVVMAKAGRTQVEVADEKAGNASRSTAKGSRSKVRALKEQPRFDLDYAGPRTHTPSHN
ncbi:uncharacterized protein LOC121983030 [Zingiber officinale]|uniref:uncharacterized protein LOC121983030 n=1 Tax=Zingiber officinale TaxID=94328 RepID=UPI001C4ADCCD|nr:uncharacterized protein LOC121983030 [Zingiber officinale]